MNLCSKHKLEHTALKCHECVYLNKENMEFLWSTEEYHYDNSQTMCDYLNNQLPDNYFVIHQDGSYAEVINKKDRKRYGIHASGNGDFFNHKVEFELITK